mmetsp:Transcript_60880/g.168472  ORF Transcript_60880/g.168472 Transcript_60880/m.168472 type:complete len:125 (+) Transcript_60880:218-592(+)
MLRRDLLREWLRATRQLGVQDGLVDECCHRAAAACQREDHRLWARQHGPGRGHQHRQPERLLRLGAVPLGELLRRDVLPERLRPVHGPHLQGDDAELLAVVGLRDARAMGSRWAAVAQSWLALT